MGGVGSDGAVAGWVVVGRIRPGQAMPGRRKQWRPDSALRHASASGCVWKCDFAGGAQSAWVLEKRQHSLPWRA